MLKNGCLSLLMLATAAAQPAPSPEPGSISGTVTEIVTGAPLAGVSVGWIAPAGASSTSAKTDASGRYTLRGVTPGECHLFALLPPTDGAPNQLGPVRKTVTLGPGQNLTSVDFQLALPGEISGKVLDENDDPVPDIFVVPLRRAYTQGRIGYSTTGRPGRTDKRGEFRALVSPGSPVILAASVDGANPRHVDPISRVPEDPARRRPATVATYYPNSDRPEGGSVLTLASGEKRELVVIHLQRSASLCVDGTILTPAGPAPMDFGVTWQDADIFNGAGSFRGTTGPDRKFRVCDLHAGSYRIEVSEPVTGQAGQAVPHYFGAANVRLADRDVRDLKIAAHGPSAVHIEVATEAEPAAAADAKVTISLVRSGARSSAETQFLRQFLPVPGATSVLLFPDAEYTVGISGLTRGWYIKDATYGGASILHNPLRPNSAAGEDSLWVYLENDGGYITARVSDKDGNPMATNVVVIPQLAVPDAELATRIVFGMTDAAGRFTTAMLPPGKYHLIASAAVFDNAPDLVTDWLAARTGGKEVELGPGGNVQIAISPVNLK